MTIDDRLTTLEALWSTWAELGQAMTQTVALLAEMAPPVAFIEVATGRSASDLFPVLS
jgi:hypothetical protein